MILAMAMSRSALFVAIVPLVGITILLLVFGYPPWPPVRVVGLVLLLPSLVLITLARFQLGSSFSVAPEARQLVTRGLYSRIRNPIYVFGSLVIAGLMLFLDRPYWLLVLALLIPLQVLRARAEARVLEEKFGDAYRQYRAKTWL
jgi:protein-S-isoprenylcysteine O-methyltransferase Ste14